MPIPLSLSLIALFFPPIVCDRAQVSFASVHGDQIDFDCQADFEKWQRAWSVEKMQYCCETEGKGCISQSVSNVGNVGKVKGCETEGKGKGKGKGCLTLAADHAARVGAKNTPAKPAQLAGERKHRRGSLAENVHRKSDGRNGRRSDGQNKVRLASSGKVVDGVVRLKRSK